MAYLPPQVAESATSEKLHRAKLKRVSQGKVRDIWKLPRYKSCRLSVATDRISAFDFVLGQEIPGKGKALTTISNHAKLHVLSGVPHDLMASGYLIDHFFTDFPSLWNDPELQARAVVIEVLDMMLFECVVRGIMTGGVWKKYHEKGERRLWGYDPLPDGMREWDDLPQAMFTPTDKAESGHDEPVTRESVLHHCGPMPEQMSIELYERGRHYARERDIELVDTKFEFGFTAIRGTLTLGDEALTPDSSRYVPYREFLEDRQAGRKPKSFDKQVVRDYLMRAELPDGRIVDVSKLDPKNDEHRKLVGSIVLPDEVVGKTVERYEALVKMITQ